MQNKYFITSRYGKIDQIPIYHFDLKDYTIKNDNQKFKLISWLKANREIIVYKISEKSFSTFTKLPESKFAQYSLINQSYLSPPFQNTVEMSGLIKQLLQHKLSLHFEIDKEGRIMIDGAKSIDVFNVHTYIRYNIELFEDGRFLIHFFPQTKISANGRKLIENISKPTFSFTGSHSPFQLILTKHKNAVHKSRFVIQNRKIPEDLYQYVNENPEAIATVDTGFISAYSLDIFKNIYEASVKLLSPSLQNIQSISSCIVFNDGIQLHEKSFLAITPAQKIIQKNLIIGGNKRVDKASATYYSGIFLPVKNTIILPLIFGDKNYEIFKVLVNENFNKNGNIKFLKSVRIKKESQLPSEPFKLLRASQSKKIVILFTDTILSPSIISQIKKYGFPFEIYCGIPENFSLSNFAIKCLNRLGGIPWILNSLSENKHTYFVGIDLGHTTRHMTSKYSNIAFTLFDYKGKLLYSFTDKVEKRNEIIQKDKLLEIMELIKKEIFERALPELKKMIIHRDGKFSEKEIQDFKQCICDTFVESDFDLVEIIKSGHPAMGVYSEKKYKHPLSGDYWVLPSKKYAILITNDQQSADPDEILLPIIIKQKSGKTPFPLLVEQVYWFTKIYNQNLYFSSRLPATTAIANKQARTTAY